MAQALPTLREHEKRDSPSPVEFYDPRGFNTRRRSSTTNQRPLNVVPDVSSSPRIDIPGTSSAAPLVSSPVAGAVLRDSRPPELSISPEQGSSGSEVETPSQGLSRSIEARLQFDISPGPGGTEAYFPSAAVVRDEPKPADLPPLRTHDSGATIKPNAVEDRASRMWSNWKWSKAGVSLGHYATAPAEPGVSSSQFTNARGRRESSIESSTSSSRSVSETAFSPAQAYLSGFSRGTSLQSLDEIAASDASQELVHGYAIGKTIGYGGFGQVRQARHLETGKKVAVKVLPSRPPTAAPSLQRSRTISTSSNRSIRSGRESIVPEVVPFPEEAAQSAMYCEVKIWSRLKEHPHILPLLDLHETLEASYIFMPFCSGGNLLQYIQEHSRRGRRRRNMSPEAHGPQRASSLRRIISPVQEAVDPGLAGGFDLGHVRHIFIQVVNGLRYLHMEAEVTHKDIKLENILLDEAGFFRIADFGLAVSRKAADHPRAQSQLIEQEADLSASWNGWPSSAPGPAEEDASFFGMVKMDTPNVGPSLQRAVSSRGLAGQAGLGAKSSLASLNTASNDPQKEASAAGGSLAYAAPELLRATPSLYSTGSPAVDMWALGCVLYALLEGSLPFSDEFEPRLRVKILDGQWTMPVVLAQPGFSLDGDSGGEVAEHAEAVTEVLQGCLERDPLKRWTIEQVAGSAWLSTKWPSTPVGEPPAIRRRTSRDPVSERQRSQSRPRGGDRSSSRSSSRPRTSTRQSSRERATPY